MKTSFDFVFFAAVTTLASAFQVSFQLTGRTLALANISYYVPGTPVATFDLGGLSESLCSHIGSNEPLIPFSVMPTAENYFDDSCFEAIVAEWTPKDDVWSPAFLQGVYIDYNGFEFTHVLSLSAALEKQYDIQFVLMNEKVFGGVALDHELPAGPYFLEPWSGNVYQAYRLYDDEHQSFDYGVLPDGNGGYEVLSAKIAGAATESIGVPSRLYFTPTAEQPLAGLRLAVKDIYDIKGLHTGCGNRAYRSLYPENDATGPALQRLLDGGMVVVGKAKTSQFANGETATADWVDYHAPYNPRGDGYQDGSASSTGPATAMAAYPWLDHSLGSDTGGSMRGPAGANGLYGNRPSHNVVVLDGVMPLSSVFDTLGIFARDAKSWKQAGAYWYGVNLSSTTYTQFPKKIMFPVDTWGSSFLSTPPVAGTADATFNVFIDKLEAFLNATRTEFNLTELWAQTLPANGSTPFATFFNTTYINIVTYDQAHLLGTPFIADYGAAHGGRVPFIDPSPLSRWQYGWTVSENVYADALAQKAMFMAWFAEQIVPVDPATCSESLLIYPQSSGTPVYRNVYRSGPTGAFGISAGRYSVFAETPDFVVPIGEQPYNSTVTNTTEYLPVTLSFVAAKGCDLMLFELFVALQDAGLIAPVTTGSRTF